MSSIQAIITQAELSRFPTTGMSVSYLPELWFPQTRIFTGRALLIICISRLIKYIEKYEKFNQVFFQYDA